MKQILILCFLATNIFSYNQKHLQNLQEALSSKQKNINISHVDFRGLSSVLQGSNLSGIQACGALFSKISQAPITIFSGLIEVPGQGSDLSNVNFSNAILVSSNFAGATLHNVNFANADVAYADFSDADLTGSKLDQAKNIDLAVFCNAIMPDGTKPTGSTWTSAKGKIIQLHCAG